MAYVKKASDSAAISLDPETPRPALRTAWHSGASIDMHKEDLADGRPAPRLVTAARLGPTRREVRADPGAEDADGHAGAQVLPARGNRATRAADRRLTERLRLLPSRAKADQLLFVEVFSGPEHFSEALRKRGSSVFSFDVLQGPRETSLGQPSCVA
eukprot:4001744-Pyramimonas_sp.AAC.1